MANTIRLFSKLRLFNPAITARAFQPQQRCRYLSMDFLTIFVPKHVDVNAIDKCFQDKKATFEHVDSATFDATAQQALLKRFMFLEKDHFLVYPDKGEPFKCHYQSRSLIMQYISHVRHLNLNDRFKEVNGLRMNKNKPIHYFMRPEDSDFLLINNTTEDNTIVEYFDSEEDKDLAKFAEIVKTKPNCNQKHFIVYRGDDYCAVETDNVENTYIFSSTREPFIMSKLVEGLETIDTLIEEDKRFKAMLAKHVPQPGFKLRDANGEIIPDGKGFSLQIVGDPEEVLDKEDDEDTEGLPEEEKLYDDDWLFAFSDSTEEYGYALCASPGNGDIFECETIDDIVYLKHEGGYLYFPTDSNSSSIYIGEAVPTKEQRIEIYYDDDGDIYLTAFEGSNYVDCDWIKCSFGVIGLYGSTKPMKLRIHM